jgi:hypothetical protein
MTNAQVTNSLRHDLNWERGFCDTAKCDFVEQSMKQGELKKKL